MPERISEDGPTLPIASSPPRDKRHAIRIVRRPFKPPRYETASCELSERAKTTIDDEIGAGDVAALIRGQKQCCGCDLLWLTKSVLAAWQP